MKKYLKYLVIVIISLLVGGVVGYLFKCDKLPSLPLPEVSEGERGTGGAVYSDPAVLRQPEILRFRRESPTDGHHHPHHPRHQTIGKAESVDGRAEDIPLRHP